VKATIVWVALLLTGLIPDRRVGHAFELGGAPFDVWYFKGCGLSKCA
jgi:hypothetical protein